MASSSWGLSFFLKPINSKAVELYLDIQLLSKLSALLGTVWGGGEVRIPGCSPPSKLLKLNTRENGVHTGGLTEFHGLKQVNPSNCHIPSLFISLEGLDILRERQVKTLRNRRHFYNYFLRKHSEFLTLYVMTTPNSRPPPLSAISIKSSALSSLRNDIFSPSLEYFLQLEDGVSLCQLSNMLR